MSEREPKKPSRVFGPVPSRRLGRSLGVDMIPYKTCSFDCIYCQVGRTTCKTIERALYAPRAELVDEVREKLESGAKPDVITMSGSGEPTLHLDLEGIIADIKQFTNIPVVVLTNGSMLYEPDVRRACACADIIVPSLDAGDDAAYQAINRPHESLAFDKVVDGLVAFRKEFAKPIWLEVFFVEGINTDDAHVRKMRALVDRIGPDKVQLNTAVRPTAEEFAVRVDEERLKAICAGMGPRAEVVADFRHVHEGEEFKAQRADVLDMLKRRPCSVEDVASGLGMHRHHVIKFVAELKTRGEIREERRGDVLYYSAAGV